MCLTGFYLVLLGFTEVNLVLYKVVMGLDLFYWVLLGFP